MAKWHKGSIREKKIDIKLRLRQMSEDIDEIIEYINKEENNVENIGPSEIKILLEGVRAITDLVVSIKKQIKLLFKNNYQYEA